MKNETREYPRFKPVRDLNYYNGDFACIHAKFGDFRKHYVFPKGFKEKYPNFCAEYDKYWDSKESVFTDPMQIVNYIEQFAVPCVLYSNYCDREFADYDAVREWICKERHIKGYDFGEGRQWHKGQSMDGHPEVGV
jgi:hypothetical protein